MKLSVFCMTHQGLCRCAQGILLADQAERLDSMNLLRLMSPVALGLLLPAIALLEPSAPSQALALAAEQPGFVALLAGNAALAYIVNFTNFQITKYTSALTLQVRTHPFPSWLLNQMSCKHSKPCEDCHPCPTTRSHTCLHRSACRS